MKKAWLIALSLFLILGAHGALAVKVNSLYQGEVPVNSQSIEERSRAVQQALSQVLIKVSGNSQIMMSPRIKSHLSSAGSLVQEFGYSTPHTPQPTQPYLLQIRFEANGVNQWLRDASAPIWGQNRPLILGWILYEPSGHAAEIISSDSINIAPMLKQRAELRGLPLIFPVMDVTDINRVPMNDIMTMSAQNLSNASKRYASGAILIGRITQDPSGFNTQWKLMMGKDQWDWSFSEKTPADALSAIIDNVANTLATRFAVVTTNNIQKNVTLKVMGIVQQTDFAQLIRYLNHLTPVADVGILRISGNEIMLSVSLRSTQQAFMQAISIGQKLTPLASDASAMPLVYQWNH